MSDRIAAARRSITRRVFGRLGLGVAIVAGVTTGISGAAHAQQSAPLLSGYDVPSPTVTTPWGLTLTPYGIFDIGGSDYTNVSNAKNTGSAGSLFLAENGVLTVSQLGLKGSQNLDPWLGNHLKIIFDISAGVDLVHLTPADPNNFFSRNAYAGIDGDFGTLTAGRQWNFNDDLINGSFITIGYRLSLFRLTEFGEFSDIHNNTVKYVTPVLGNFAGGGVQAGVYYQFKGDDSTPFDHNNITEGMVRFKSDTVSAAVVYDRETDADGNPISNMVTVGGSYRIGDLKLRAFAGFNSLSPGVSPYPGGAGPISVPFNEQANVYLIGADWSITPQLTLSGDVAYRDNVTLHNNTQVYRLLANYRLTKNLSFYSQIGYEVNGGGAAESFYSDGASSYLGSGYSNQTQFAFINGFEFKF